MNLCLKWDTLLEIMAEKRWDPGALAALTGVHASQNNRLISGRRQPGPHFVEGVMAAGILVERVIGVDAAE